MNCVLHYIQMSEAVRQIIPAFSPAFCHFSPIFCPRGHGQIECGSSASMFDRLILLEYPVIAQIRAAQHILSARGLRVLADGTTPGSPKKKAEGRQRRLIPASGYKSNSLIKRLQIYFLYNIVRCLKKLLFFRSTHTQAFLSDHFYIFTLF